MSGWVDGWVSHPTAARQLALSLIAEATVIVLLATVVDLG